MSGKIGGSVILGNDGKNVKDQTVKTLAKKDIHAVPPAKSNLVSKETDSKSLDPKSQIVSRDLRVVEEHGHSNDRKGVRSESLSGDSGGVGGVPRECSLYEFVRKYTNRPNVKEIIGSCVLGKKLGGGTYGDVYAMKTAKNSTGNPQITNCVVKKASSADSLSNCQREINMSKGIDGAIQNTIGEFSKYVQNAVGAPKRDSSGVDCVPDEKAPQFFLASAAEFIPQYMGHDGPDIFTEMASGTNLDDAACSREAEARFKLPKGKIFSQTELAQLAKEGMEHVKGVIIIMAQIAAAIAFLHENKFIHNDLKPANIVCDLKNGISKLIDFGLTSPIGNRDGVPMVPYCSSLEECLYELHALSGKLGNKSSVINGQRVNLKFLGDAITNPASEVYGIGMLLMFSFGHRVSDFFNDNLGRGYRTLHDHVSANIFTRTNSFDGNLHNLLVFFNDGRPEPIRYTPSQLSFLEELIRCCINPDPTKRPTAAQVSYMLEMLVAGVENFGTAANCAIADRPMPNDYFSPAAIEAYKILGISPGPNSKPMYNSLHKSSIFSFQPKNNPQSQSSSSSSQPPNQSQHLQTISLKKLMEMDDQLRPQQAGGPSQQFSTSSLPPPPPNPQSQPSLSSLQPQYNPQPQFPAPSLQPQYNPQSQPSLSSLQPQYNPQPQYPAPSLQPQYNPQSQSSTFSLQPQYNPQPQYSTYSLQPQYNPQSQSSISSLQPQYNPQSQSSISLLQPQYNPQSQFSTFSLQPQYNPQPQFSAPSLQLQHNPLQQYTISSLQHSQQAGGPSQQYYTSSSQQQPPF
ncbi:MAG: protein kinase [Puniceicoccales bacterium]|jgi:serine/threonine protein kinase|nr:protein kinase [Puniceicoccales bacterium]